MANERELAENNLIFKCITGSRAYGIETPQSDTDIQGIFIAPPEYHLGCFNKIEQVLFKSDDGDATYYEIDKFIKLCVECNPNIIELLFNDDCNILRITKPFELLRENAHLFLSKKARFTFSGYAMAQLKRIKGHNKWIMNPQPKKPPTIDQFCSIYFPLSNDFMKQNLNQYNNNDFFLVKLFGGNSFKLFYSYRNGQGIIANDGNNLKYLDEDPENRYGINMSKQLVGILFCQVDKFKEANKLWNQYWNWKNNRNPDRAALEEKFNYDTKHACHLVRLLRMGEEILTEGKVIVRRPDAEELKNIRNGLYTYGYLVDYAEKMDKYLEELYEKSNLPKYPNIEKINKLLIKIKMHYWNLWKQ